MRGQPPPPPLRWWARHSGVACSLLLLAALYGAGHLGVDDVLLRRGGDSPVPHGPLRGGGATTELGASQPALDDSLPSSGSSPPPPESTADVSPSTTGAGSPSTTAAATPSASGAQTPSASGAGTPSATAAVSPSATGAGTPAASAPPSSSAAAAAAAASAAGSALAAAACPRMAPLGQGLPEVDACDWRVVNHLHLVNSGAAAWAAYAQRVRERVRVAREARTPPAATVSDEAAQEVVDEAHAAAALWGDIERSQAVPQPATQCATARVLLLQYPINGFASAFGLFGGALMQARLRNRLLVMDEQSGWAYSGGPDKCPQLATTGQWGCYFQPVGACTYANANITVEQRKAAVGAGDAPSATGGPRVVTMDLNMGSLFWHEHLAQLPVPQPYTRWGPAWWRVHHFLYLFRLNAPVTAAVVDLVRASKVGAVGGSSTAYAQQQAATGGFVAWHVRHGDKVVEKHATYAADEFLPALADVANNSSSAGGPPTRLFLASDDPAVVEQVPGLLAPTFSVFALQDRMKLGASLQESALLARNDAESAFVLAVEAIANIWMMSEGSRFVGIFHSNFGRLAVELQYAKGHSTGAYSWQDGLLCDHSGHFHPDRDGYFDARAPWYLPLRRARRELGLPPGLF